MGYLVAGRLVAGGGFDAGEITIRAVPASGNVGVELVLNDAGSIDLATALPLIDPFTEAVIDLPSEIIPGRDFIGWVEGDTIVEAGPVWGDPFDFPYSDRTVAGGLWTYFDHRYVLPVLSGGQLPRDVTSKWSGLSLRTIAKRLVQQACAHTGAALPIDFETDVAGDHEREYPGDDAKLVGEALRDLTGVEGGPDIAFRPKWGADRKHIRWALVTGSPELTQAGGDHYWDTSVPEPYASLVSLDRDGSELTSREYQFGATFRNLVAGDGDRWQAGANAASLGFNANGGWAGTWYATWLSSAAGTTVLEAKASTAIKPGDPVTGSAYVQAPSRGMRVMLRFRNEDGTTLLDSAPSFTTVPSTGDNRISHSAVAPANSTTVQMYVEGNASAGGQLFVATAPQLHLTSELLPFDAESTQVQAVASDATLIAAGFPLLESSTNRGSVIRADTLQAYANEAVARGSSHVETFEIRARRDMPPVLGSYQPGDYASLRIGKNPRIAPGTRRVRIVSMSFAKTGDVSITCAPERVASGYSVPSTNKNYFRDQLRTLTRALDEQNRGS